MIRRIALLLLLGIVSTTGSAAELKALPPNTEPPPLALPDLQGHKRTLADYRGKVVLVNFWASWCPPCVREMPSMQRLNAALKDRPFVIVTVNMDETREEITTFLHKLKIHDFVVLMDRGGKVLQRWKVHVFPTSFVLDAKGKLRYAFAGAPEWDEGKVRKQIEALVAEAMPDTAAPAIEP